MIKTGNGTLGKELNTDYFMHPFHCFYCSDTLVALNPGYPLVTMLSHALKSIEDETQWAVSYCHLC